MSGTSRFISTGTVINALIERKREWQKRGSLVPLPDSVAEVREAAKKRRSPMPVGERLYRLRGGNPSHVRPCGQS